MPNFPWPSPKPDDKGWNVLDWLREQARKNASNNFTGDSAPDGMNSRYNPYPVKAVDSINGSMAGESARNNTGMGQPGLNVPGGGGSGGSGGGISSIEQAYAALIARLKGVGVDNSALVDKSIGAVKGNYSAADSDVYKQYMGARDDLTGRAGNLGVDFDKSQMGQNWDATLRRTQEMSNSNLNSDLSYFEKMRELKQSAIDAMVIGAEQEKSQKIAAAQAAMRAAASRAASSGAKASETQTIENVGDVEIYNKLKKSNPAAAQLYYQAYWGNEGDPSKAIVALMNRKGHTNTKPGAFNFLTNSIASYNRAQEPNINSAIEAMQLLTKLWGNPGITQKVTT